MQGSKDRCSRSEAGEGFWGKRGNEHPPHRIGDLGSAVSSRSEFGAFWELKSHHNSVMCSGVLAYHDTSHVGFGF